MAHHQQAVHIAVLAAGDIGIESGKDLWVQPFLPGNRIQPQQRQGNDRNETQAASF